MTKPTVAVRWVYCYIYPDSDVAGGCTAASFASARFERRNDREHGRLVSKIVRIEIPLPAPAKARKAGK